LPPLLAHQLQDLDAPRFSRRQYTPRTRCGRAPGTLWVLRPMPGSRSQCGVPRKPPNPPSRWPPLPWRRATPARPRQNLLQLVHVQLDDRGLRLDHEKSPRQGDETTGTAGNLGGNGSPQQAGTMRSMVGFTQTHHSTHPTKTKRAIRCPRAPTGHRCAALVGVGRPAAIGHRHEALVGMVGLVGESFQSAAPGSAGYPTARHTGAARVASGSPAAGRTCNW